MNIAVDAMGGDNAPLEVVKGVINAALEYKDLNITLVGDEAKIRDISREIGVVIPNNVEILHSSSEVTMEDDPMIVMKEKKDSSMAMGLKLLKEDGADAFVSAGNTGALHTASTLIVRKMKGVRRSAIAAILPFDPPVLLLDSGANPVVTADLLLQWAIIGSAYMKNVFGVENPRVGLLNNGTEEHKGTPVACEAFSLLKKSKVINFVGNIESKEIPNSPCDVLVTDGFTGNIALKLIEGMGKFIGKSLNDIFRSNVFTKLSYLITFKEEISKFRTKLDASEYGGAPLLGLSKPVIKAHGSSKAKEIKNAIRQAIEYTNSNIIEEVSKVF
jgi:glycerol-3-phosphate acyltransferase PlsX